MNWRQESWGFSLNKLSFKFLDFIFHSINIIHDLLFLSLFVRKAFLKVFELNDFRFNVFDFWKIFVFILLLSFLFNVSLKLFDLLLKAFDLINVVFLIFVCELGSNSFEKLGFGIEKIDHVGLFLFEGSRLFGFGHLIDG